MNKSSSESDLDSDKKGILESVKSVFKKDKDKDSLRKKCKDAKKNFTDASKTYFVKK